MISSTEINNTQAYTRLVFVLVTCLFFLSGMAGLVYQVLWMRSLGLFFGSDMYGVAIILGTFMGGLALGSLLGGRFGEQVSRPLMWYGLMEIGIGVFALLVPSILELFDPILRAGYATTLQDTGNLYQVLRVVLASGTVLIPTVFMGATLPLIMRHFVRTQSALGEIAAFFYGVNTLGALIGTLVAGFFLLPYFGVFSSTLFTAAVNFSIGFICIMVGLKCAYPGVIRPHGKEHDDVFDTLPDLGEETRRRIARAAMIGIAISGVGSFALEVVWTRILIMSFSATVYSFTSMLACFLFGIFLGSLLVAKIVDRIRDPLVLLARLELGVGATVALLCMLINVIPEFFSRMLGFSMRLLPGGEGWSLVLATLAASFFLLVVPATLLGATFSVALRAYTMDVSRIGSRTGNVYFANTAGAIIGSLGAVLLLLPVAGAKGGLAFIAVLFSVNGIYLLLMQYGFKPKCLVRASVVVPLVFTAATVTAGLSVPYQLTLNFNQQAGNNTRIIYHKEGVQNTIDIIRSDTDVTSLVIGGNIEADNGYTQRRHFVLKGHLPLMLHDRPETALVVGLGMGITLNATMRHEDSMTASVVELSPEIIAAHAWLSDINGDVVHNPRVRVRIDDGRSFMRLSGMKYDMITADPIHPKVSRVGYLYTREYYQSIKERLNSKGIVCQWMPIYQISPTRLRSAMKTFIEVFPNAMFWYVKNHGLLVSREGSQMIDYDLLVEKFSIPTIREDLGSIDIVTPEDLLSLLLMGPEEIHAYINDEPGIPLNTDDYPYLEYFVPGDFFYQPARNVRELVKHLADPSRFVINQPPESVAEVTRLTVSARDSALLQP